MLTQLTRNWWALALRGLFAIAFGITAFAWPGITVGAMAALFGAYALVDGVFGILVSIRHRRDSPHAWVLLVEGILGVVAAMVAIFWPSITAFALVIVIGCWAIATGVFEIVAAVRLREEAENEWLLGGAGVLSILCGVLLFVNPQADPLSVLWLIAAYAVMFGVILVALGFWLRGIQSQLPPVPAT